MADRSRAYPGVPLDECIANVRLLRREAGNSSHDRPTIAKALGMGETTAIRPVAAMVHFGLLARDKGDYSVSELGKVACDPLDGEIKGVLAKCIRTPALYRELIEKYEAEERFPEQLATVFHRHFDITQKAAGLAADVFLQSAHYAGLIDDSFRIVGGTEIPASAPAPTRDTDPTDVPQHNSQPEPTDTQHFVINLSGGTARLSFPADLSEKDIKILRKQIELLELQVGP